MTLSVSEPLVSVIVTSYNYGEFIADCLRSVHAQTYERFECIVVDDCSTDDTPAVVTTLLDELKDTRLRYLRLPRNVGSARRTGGGLPREQGRVRRLPRRRRSAVPALHRASSLRPPQHRDGGCVHQLEPVDHLARRPGAVEAPYRSREPRVRDAGNRPRGEGRRLIGSASAWRSLSVLARQERSRRCGSGARRAP